MLLIIINDLSTRLAWNYFEHCDRVSFWCRGRFDHHPVLHACQSAENLTRSIQLCGREFQTKGRLKLKAYYANIIDRVWE